ncbi:MAG: hypothetical protein JWM26_2042 [Betaproteobacteria bacterium]|nr:hypothetical protein [Betaproteobacteria bacterium]
MPSRTCASRAAAVSLLLALGGCLAGPPLHPSATTSPQMRPEVFFAGSTRGDGQLTERGRDPRPFKVAGEGRAEPDGSFRLDQTVTFADGEVRTRTWRLRRVDDTTYTGSVSDAAGEVTGDVDGNVFHVRYLMRKPAVYMEQWLYLQRDGCSVINFADVSVVGVAWARLGERIVRLDCAK